MRRVLLFFIALIGALLTFSRLFGRREDTDWKDAPRPGRVVAVDGVAVHYVEAGRGAPLVLVHGFGAHTFTFRHLIPLLSPDFRVIALDLKGFGYTERTKTGGYGAEDQARMLLRFMDVLDIERAAVLGHSYGGEVAMRAAAIAPERIERLVLAGSSSGDRFPSLPVTPLLKPFLPLLVRIIGAIFLPRNFHDGSRLTPEVAAAYRAPGRIRGTMDALYRMLKDMRKDRPVEFAEVRQPALILWADDEKIVPQFVLRKLQKRLPQARTVTIAQAGHLLVEEQPEACAAAIREFLRQPAPDEVVDTQTVG